MEFQPIKAEDKDLINNYFTELDARNCDFGFAVSYLWRNFYETKYTICEGALIFKSNEEKISYSFPIGGDTKKALEKLKEHTMEKGIPLVLHSVSRKAEEFLNENYPEEYDIKFDRDMADYIYDREALVELRGKKYHGKKNHINKFKKLYDWSYETINDDNTEECLAMLNEWKEQNCDPKDLEKHAEICVSQHSLTEREMLGLKGGLIRADGKVVAFSIGEKMNSDTFVVHIEKAFSHVQGAYAIINQQFLLHEAEDCKYVNREDDVGEENLRKAKMSYHPVFMEEKGFALWKGSTTA